MSVHRSLHSYGSAVKSRSNADFSGSGPGSDLFHSKFTACSQIRAQIVQRIQCQCTDDGKAAEQAAASWNADIGEHGPTKKNRREAQTGSGEVIGREEGRRVIGAGARHVHEHALHDNKRPTHVETDYDDTCNPMDGFPRGPCYVQPLSASHDSLSHDT